MGIHNGTTGDHRRGGGGQLVPTPGAITSTFLKSGHMCHASRQTVWTGNIAQGHHPFPLPHAHPRHVQVGAISVVCPTLYSAVEEDSSSDTAAPHEFSDTAVPHSIPMIVEPCPSDTSEETPLASSPATSPGTRERHVPPLGLQGLDTWLHGALAQHPSVSTGVHCEVSSTRSPTSPLAVSPAVTPLLHSRHSVAATAFAHSLRGSHVPAAVVDPVVDWPTLYHTHDRQEDGADVAVLQVGVVWCSVAWRCAALLWCPVPWCGAEWCVVWCDVEWLGVA